MNGMLNGIWNVEWNRIWNVEWNGIWNGMWNGLWNGVRAFTPYSEGGSILNVQFPACLLIAPIVLNLLPLLLLGL